MHKTIAWCPRCEGIVYEIEREGRPIWECSDCRGQWTTDGKPRLQIVDVANVERYSPVSGPVDPTSPETTEWQS